ncbi:MAG: response regulator [Calditrichaeota bacterium]|nr:response regulator [Calditrichota bacterium]MCB0270605.1 response regulator [Calditrichota bacterium]MCB0298567.1 response regulator [Calditrichota bacterium]MCB9067418.1 response regulator [Calditrichia bacterium]
MNKAKILWVDDEVEFLQPHILFLRDKGYDVETATNAEDGIELIRNQKVDLLLIDEMMPGLDGLTAVSQIKQINPGLPIIMITKNEEESLMEDAIGAQITDYLTKPVNPSQILLAAKKILESRNISQKKFTRDYMQELNKINLRLMDRLEPEDWIDIFLKLSTWDVELDAVPDKNLREIIQNQRRECNVEFGKYIERNYLDWVNAPRDERPTLSHDIITKYVYPELKAGKKVAFFVIDCLRLDQWLSLEPYFYDYYKIQKDYYYSILPTATPYARNAIFSGLLPSDLEKRYPEMWAQGEDDDSSRNRYEKELLYDHLRLLGLKLDAEPRYLKIISAEEGYNLEKNLSSHMNTPLLSVVVNFVDILAHSRSDLPILKQIAPDEPSYRSLTCSWFEHSPIYSVFKQLAEQDVTIFVTSDHGSIRCMRGTKVLGDRETSTNLRYKYGRNLKADNKHAFFIHDPEEGKLPKRNINMNYIVAKEDYYFVYPTNYHKYLSYYRDSFQHGGISLEEMVLPVIKLQPK